MHTTISWRSAALGLVTLLVALLAVLVVNTVLTTSHQTAAVAPVDTPPRDSAAPRRLATAITFRTVSSGTTAADRETFRAFHEFLREAFPGVHDRLIRTEISGSSVLFEWMGRDPAARPVLLLAHQDVVPVLDAEAWTEPPFAGAIADGYVWGRGAMDDKSSLMGLLEAVEQLLADDFQPARTVYLAFGHDEETGGEGAREVAAYLGRRGVKLEFVLDEGGFVADGLIPGVAAPIALVGIAEKGYLTVELTSEEEGGHSSRPPAHTAIGNVSRAVARLEEHPFPARLDGAAEQLFVTLAPHLPFGQRFAIANRWLLEPVLLSALTSDPSTATLVRTTTAPTMFRAGEKDNVLAPRATATVNLRILPGDTVDGTLARIRRIIDDPRVEVRALIAIEPSPTSSTTSPSWALLGGTIGEVLGDDVIVAPWLMVAGTDSRHFVPIADDVYRFFALTVTPQDVARFHGVDERISLGDYANVIAVYRRLLENL
ncbi:MAG TPA: M20 family peptidase [Woeseiaceae bacterium]